MRRGRVLIGVAVLAAATALPAGASGPAAAVLRVSASTSATVEVTLPKVTIDWSYLTLSGPVSYAALYLEPLARSVAATAGTGGFVADAMRLESEPSLVVGLGLLDIGGTLGKGPRFAHQTAVPAGRYLVHVLTPKAVTLSVPLSGASRSIVVTAKGTSHDRLSVRAVDPAPASGAPGAAYDRSPLPQPTHAITRTLSILRTVSPIGPSSTTLMGCRRQTSGADGAPSPAVATSASPVCGGADDGEGWAYYDSSRRDFSYLPPIPLLIPEGGASTSVLVQYYERPVPSADQITAVSSLDNIKDVSAASVVVALRR